MERDRVRLDADRELTAVADAAPTIRRYGLRFALDGWCMKSGRAEQVSYHHEAAQGIVFALLRHAAPGRAVALHDANERKALSVGPVAIRAVAGGLARADLTLGVWEPSLVALVGEALHGAADARLELAGAPALLLGWESVGAWTVAELLATPAAEPVRVRFTSPTRFGFGRHPNGNARGHLVPDPGPVVASWLRAWRLTGDRSLDWLPTSPEALAEAIALVELREVRTVVVAERTASLPGFLGETAYRWEGREPAGRRALATLARFAGVCGTGAKTGRGFGQTVPLGLDPPTARGA